MVPLQVDAEATRGGVHHADAFGHHFRSDSVSGNHGDLVLAHVREGLAAWGREGGNPAGTAPAAALGSDPAARDNSCILLQSGSPLPPRCSAMCQLLGMNCATPTDVTFSFTGFAARGGVTDHHADGFGVAFFEDKACRLFIDNQSAGTSPVADLIKRYPIKSKNVISHIRKATQGTVLLENCHPFMRELWAGTGSSPTTAT